MSRPIASETVFTAISHATRRRILDLLRAKDRTVMDIASNFNTTLPNITQHLRVLRTAGLISQRRVGRHRMYTFHPRSMKSVSVWIRPFDETGASRRSSFSQPSM